MRRRLAASAWLCLAAVPALAGDWTQFRGPDGNGSAEEHGLPVHWGPDKNVRWTADLPGRGLSCPVVAGGRIYVTASSGFEESRLHVLCFDLATGKRLWERQHWSTGVTLCHPKTCMAAPTPVTDGERVYALFATGDLVCYDRDGTLLWYRSLTGDYPTIGNNVGMAASPTLWKDTLLVPMINAGESFAAGIDVRTGRNRWKYGLPRDINWVTPVVITHVGRPEALFQSARGIWSFDPQTGRLLWQTKGMGFSPVASPAAGEGLVFAPAGALVALRPSADGQAPRQAWTAPRLRTDYSSPLFYRGKVYAINGAGVLNCADAATGKVLWQQRLSNKGLYWASPVGADGRIYTVNEPGIVTVVKDGEQPTVVATNDMKDTILATPTIAHGALFLRSDKHLYCITDQGNASACCPPSAGPARIAAQAP